MTIEKLKVLHVTNSLKGGAGAAAYRIHEALIHKGVLSTIIAQDVYEKNQYEKFIDFSSYGFKLLSFSEKLRMLIINPLYSLKRALYSVQFRRIYPQIMYDYISMPYGNSNFLERVNIDQYDVVHLHWISHIIDYPLFFAKCNKPIVWTLHDINPLTGLYHYENDENKNAPISGSLSQSIKAIKFMAMSQHKAKKIFVGPSKWITDFASAATKKWRNTMSIEISNPVNLEIFRFTERNEARRKVGLAEDKKVILFNAHDLGNFRKGFDLLIEALSYIQIDNIELIAVGNRPLTQQSIDIQFIGLINDNKLLATYYSAADVVIIPSREDNLPNVMVEAFACGLPVIGFAVGGIKQHVIDNFTGMLASEITALSLSETIQYYFQNISNWDRGKIRLYAVEKFSPSVVAQQYLNVYENALKNASV